MTQNCCSTARVLFSTVCTLLTTTPTLAGSAAGGAWRPVCHRMVAFMYQDKHRRDMRADTKLRRSCEIGERVDGPAVFFFQGYHPLARAGCRHRVPRADARPAAA
ncbi:hypothetical protein KCP70_01360 [Salmonella enterica subsp. enterica]|nr:hypothetical protein KCP70_01360 [Salmonella enterica subsp. enterica]